MFKKATELKLLFMAAMYVGLLVTSLKFWIFERCQLTGNFSTAQIARDGTSGFEVLTVN